VFEEVRLRGTRCLSCGEVFFGKYVSCENCGGTDVQEIRLSQHGKLYSYTVMRGKPSPNYKGPDPFVPYGVGLIELPEGCRVMAPLTIIEGLYVGMQMELVIETLYRNAEDCEVVAFKFKPVDGEHG
jgi:uncharacterized OB-fold protein